MPNRGKKYIEANQKVDRLKKYAFKEAVELAIDSSYVKFDASLDVSVRLGVDPRHADQMVRGAVSLPHGIGKPVRVIVFAKGEKEKKQQKPVLIWLVLRISRKRSKMVGLNSTRQLLLLI